MSERWAIEHGHALSLLEYNPATGILVWKRSRGGRVSGTAAGCSSPDGYLRVGLNKNKLLVHRLIWFLVTGRWPTNDIDHINGIRTDNRWVNLRECSRAENRQNLAAKNPVNKTTGLIGASFDKNRGNFRAYININRKQINLGRFNTGEEAHRTYLAAKANIHTHTDRMLGGSNVSTSC